MQKTVVSIISLLFYVSICTGNTAASETVTLYTEAYPPYSHIGQDGKLTGISVNLVRQIMAETGLKYEIRLMPWSRTLRAAEHDTYSLIFSLSRTAPREAKFDWLALLARPEFYLFGHKTDARTVTAEGIREGLFTTICVEFHSSCSIMRKAGFPETKIFMRGDGGDSETMVAHGRIDLYLSDLRRNPYRLRQLGLAHDSTKPMFPVAGEVTFYLAAGLHVSQGLRDHVRNAVRRIEERGKQTKVPN